MDKYDFNTAKKCYNCINYLHGSKEAFHLRDDEFEFLYYYNKIHDRQKRNQILSLIKAIGLDKEY